MSQVDFLQKEVERLESQQLCIVQHHADRANEPNKVRLVTSELAFVLLLTKSNTAVLYKSLFLFAILIWDDGMVSGIHIPCLFQIRCLQLVENYHSDLNNFITKICTKDKHEQYQT